MYRTALVALKPADDNAALLAYACQLASAHGLHLRGVAILDRDLVAPPEAVPLGAMAFKAELDEQKIKKAREEIAATLEAFHARCSSAGVPHSAAALEDVLAAEIAETVQRHDVLLLGHTASTSAGAHPDEPTMLHAILKNCPRPAIVVPAPPDADGSVVVAYDGSAQSARAIESFVASELFAGAPVHVVSYRSDGSARRAASLAGDYLGSHDYRVELDVGELDRPPAVADAILDACARHSASLLVMGAYGKAFFRELVFGSVTKSVLSKAALPILLGH